MRCYSVGLNVGTLQLVSRLQGNLVRIFEDNVFEISLAPKLQAAMLCMGSSKDQDTKIRLQSL